jgi:hypothetical protein
VKYVGIGRNSIKIRNDMSIETDQLEKLVS